MLPFLRDVCGCDVVASSEASPATASIPIIMITQHDGRGAHAPDLAIRQGGVPVPTD
ncbi:MAG TPA: hypothetical protein VK753_07245 [Xanthomonadaceae bacterium]|jgi:hypothetical protein|nr:hypothetical protein [Xanthomonadaceae bacterium]